MAETDETHNFPYLGDTRIVNDFLSELIEEGAKRSSKMVGFGGFGGDIERRIYALILRPHNVKEDDYDPNNVHPQFQSSVRDGLDSLVGIGVLIRMKGATLGDSQRESYRVVEGYKSKLDTWKAKNC